MHNTKSGIMATVLSKDSALAIITKAKREFETAVGICISCTNNND